MSDPSALYTPLIERDDARIPQAVRTFADAHGFDELWLAITRFAVLAFAPSQHAKHALLSCLAAHDLREESGDRWQDLLIECARYAAGSRQPWSEPPILEPPPGDPADGRDLDQLRAAIASRDRLAAEHWLAARLDSPTLTDDLYTVAGEDFEDLGHKLIVSVGAVRLANLLGEKGRFAALRVALWEMTGYSGETFHGSSDVDPRDLLQSLVANAVAEEGSIESAHAVFLLDAALETNNPTVLRRTSRWLESDRTRSPSAPRVANAAPQPPIYSLARDYAAFLKARAVASRLGKRFADVDMTPFVDAVALNLEQAPSFEDWSFA